MKFEKDWGRLGLSLSDWKEYKIADLVKIIFSGGTPNTKVNEYWNGSLPWLSSGETKNRYINSTEKTITESGAQNSSTRLALSGDVVMASAGQGYTRGQVSFLNIDTFINQSVIAIRANEKVLDKKFLFYNLSSRYEELRAISDSNSIRGSITTKMVKSMNIRIPDLNTQKAIANTLSSIDDKIETSKQINHHLEQMAQAIFKSWFIDFEPFGGVKPFDWQEGVFSEIVSSTLSGDWGKENPMGNYQKMVYCMRGADLPEITFGNKGKMPVRYILPKNFTNKQLTANNIVIEISGGSPTQSTGRCALITQSLLDRYECDMVCTNFCRAIKPKEGYSEFIYYYWRYLYEHNVMFLYENGTTGIKNLDISSFLENEKIIIPTLNSVHKFSNIVQKLRNTIATNGLEIEKLTNLRDTLLPKLLSGEISVNQATK